MPPDCAGATEFEAICNDRIKPGSLNCSLVVGPLLWAGKRTKKGGEKRTPKMNAKSVQQLSLDPFCVHFLGPLFAPLFWACLATKSGSAPNHPAARESCRISNIALPKHANLSPDLYQPQHQACTKGMHSRFATRPLYLHPL